MKRTGHQPPRNWHLLRAARRFGQSRGSIAAAVAVLSAAFFVGVAIPRARGQWFADEFRKALLARPDDWDQHCLDEAVSGIVALQDELGMKFSYEQIEAISQGLRDPTWERAAADWMHPLWRRRNVLRIVHGVREYLLKGPADPARRAQALKELQQWADARRDFLSARYEGEADTIAEAEADVLAMIADHCRNPLRCTYVLPVGEEMLAEAEKNWEKLVSGFEDSPERAFLDRKSQFNMLFHRGLIPLLQAPESAEEEPAEIAAANAQISAHLAEISEWQNREWQRKIDEERLDDQYAALLDDGVDGEEWRLKLPDPPDLESLAERASPEPSAASGQHDRGRPPGNTGLPVDGSDGDEPRPDRGAPAQSQPAKGNADPVPASQNSRPRAALAVRLAGLVAAGCLVGVTLLCLRKRRRHGREGTAPSEG